MAARFEAFGLSELVARPEDAFRLCSLAMAEGSRVRGYRGDYYRLLVGDAVVIVRTMEDGSSEPQLLGMDTHAVTQSQWTCRIVKNITPADADPMSCRLQVAKDGVEGDAVVDVLCADVLPSLQEGETITMSMAAFPLRINYSNDPCTPVISGQEDTILLQGRIKDLRSGETYMGMEPMTRFVIVTVETPLGDVDICHTGDMMEESQKDLVKIGATVSAYCILSGSVAVGNYAAGVVFSEDTDLELLRQVLIHGGGDRMKGILRNDSTFHFLEREAEGLDDVVTLFREVDAAMEGQPDRRVDYGRITDADGDDAVLVRGKRCLLIGDADREGYAMLAYVETDSVGRIRNIVVTRDPRFDFEPEK